MFLWQARQGSGERSVVAIWFRRAGKPCHHRALPRPPWTGVRINPYILCALGAIIGLLAGAVMGSNGKIVRIEDVLVGVFGAFIGGEFLPSMFGGAAPAAAATATAVPAIPGVAAAPVAVAATSLPVALAAGTAGAVVLLLVLRAMRKSVGPLKNSKPRGAKRY
jgi:uncharacterized membrane protein YeaQ/YmgE (transglycosylase-associated protein family)